MSTALWIASFLYLAALTAWITTDVKTGEDAPPLSEGETHASPLWRAISFFLLIVTATVGFCGVILLIEKAT
jgi:hypothetical protein